MYTTENYTSTSYRAKIFVFSDKYRKKKHTSKRIKQNGYMYTDKKSSFEKKVIHSDSIQHKRLH